MSSTPEVDNIWMLETFFTSRFRLIPPLYSIAIAFNVESIALRHCSLKDEFGPVRANIAHAFIGPSGLGIKSPPLKTAKQIIDYCFPNYRVHGLSRFTVEGAIQYIGGRKATKKEREDEGKEDLQPHLWGNIARDEITRLFSDRRKSTMGDNWEFLSELLDGEIEPYTTRTYGFEGGLKDLHYSLLVCGSNLFLKELDEDFWEQGLGNRIDWITEVENTRVERIDGNKFFLEQSSVDDQLNELKNKVKTHIERMETVTSAHVFPDAREKWTRWLEELQNRAYKVKGMEGSFLSKYMLKSLKYAMLRASSNEDRIQGMLNIRLNHMEQAIADCGLYEG
ncbi:hypothetical protein MUP77_05000, partial [Candidatus Bathyarchaeota archaeon]|nr:hypothetical protein [Candidatus Bathyarchaeota archaeon]